MWYNGMDRGGDMSIRLSEKSPWQLQSYKIALREGHTMSDIEFKHRLDEIDAAMEESSSRMRSESNARDA